MNEAVLSVSELSVQYRTKNQTTYAVSGVSFALRRGEVLALVGESGAGKSTVAMSLLRLLGPGGEITGGEVWFRGRDLLAADERDLRSVRGRHVAMIFQDPVAGLNPVIPIGDQVAEILLSHLDVGKREAKQRALQILRSVGLPDPQRIARSYPFQLSGGMCQRVMIGIATALDPDVIIADEPTSALDVTVQAQILHQLDTLRRERGTAILLITHAFGVVAQLADDVGVMYGGRLVETGTVTQIMKSPLHPYTHALLAALPRLHEVQEQLHAIPGTAPELTAPAEHCPFIPRCRKVMNVCRAEPPPPLSDGESLDHPTACYNPIWQDPAPSD